MTADLNLGLTRRRRPNARHVEIVIEPNVSRDWLSYAFIDEGALTLDRAETTDTINRFTGTLARLVCHLMPVMAEQRASHKCADDIDFDECDVDAWLVDRTDAVAVALGDVADVEPELPSVRVSVPANRERDWTARIVDALAAFSQ